MRCLPIVSLLLPVSIAAQSYAIVDLGVLNPTGYSYSGDINNLGQVTGTALAPNGLSEHAFFHDGATISDLGTLGGTYSWGHDINDAGQIVGYSMVNSLTLHAYVWQAGAMTSTHFGSLSFSRAEGINRTGAMCGLMTVPGSFVSPFHAWLIDGSSQIDLGTLGGADSHARAINDFGQVVGYAENSIGNRRAFRWDGAGMIELGDLGGTYGDAKAINNHGWATGLSKDASDNFEGFVHDGNSMIGIGNFGGAWSEGRGINKWNDVVGQAEYPSGDRRAARWSAGVLTDLNNLIPAGGGWVLTGANGINDLGQICGTGRLNGVRHAYRLDPVGMHHSGLVPNIAGTTNTLHVIGAQGGAIVFLVLGFWPGSTPVPGCPGISVDFAPVWLLDFTVADANGRAGFDLAVPAAARGLRVELQVVDPVACAVSPAVADTIR